MGSLEEDKSKGLADVVEDAGEEESEPEVELSSEFWPFRDGEGTWQSTAASIKERMTNLHNSREMSDLCILACDENWWFGETVKDFTVGTKSVCTLLVPLNCDTSVARNAMQPY